MTRGGATGGSPVPGTSASQRRTDALQAAHAAALAALPGIGPANLARIVGDHSPVEAWEEVRAGRILRPAPRSARNGRRAGPAAAGADPRQPPQAPLFEQDEGPTNPVPRPRRPWADIARRLDPVEWWKPYAAAGVLVTWRGGPRYPAALLDDPEPPGVLFWRGRVECLDSLCVAIVGTRNATPDGRGIAFELARDLAEAGICVVSGLALGIDGAAHAGALAAARRGAPGSTVGIAASGVDVPYPRRHASLWRDVTATGALLSETPPGRPAQAWRFPSRNRVIAGLVRMVVVVESHMCGGSLITAEAAIERGVEVRVVPGPVHSPASAGSNQLLYDGPGPVRDARDVLDALGLLRSDRPSARSARSTTATGSTAGAAGAAPRSQPDAVAGRVLEAVGWRPASTGQVMARTGLDAARAIAALDRLVATGDIAAEGGWWVRRA